MQRTTVKSSSIKSIGYDPQLNILHVEFKNGKVYAYHDVKLEHYENLMKAKSLGSHVATNIRTKFKHSKIV